MDDVGDHILDQPGVIALRHDPNDRLRAGWADDEPTGIAELRFAIGNRPLDGYIVERFSILVADIL